MQAPSYLSIASPDVLAAWHQVAGELETAERTVKFHRANIMQKMRAKSLADLVRMAEKIAGEPG